MARAAPEGEGGRLRQRPEIAMQGLRFAIAGGTAAVVYLLSTTALSVVVGMPFQVALAIGSCLALVVHFSLQRMFVWAHQRGFALALPRQIRRYLLAAGAQYGVTVASTALLPAALGLPVEVVYIATALVLALANFLVLRYGVFHPTATVAAPACAPVPKAL